MIRGSSTKANVLAVAALAGPALVVSLGHELIGSGPRATQGAAAPTGAEASSAAGSITPKEAKALARAKEVSSLAEPQSPFRPSQKVQAPVPEPVVEPTDAPALISKPEVHLRMILRQADGSARALINGNSWSAGDAFSDGWIIESIDAKARSVTFVSGDGQTFTVSLDAR